MWQPTFFEFLKWLWKTATEKKPCPHCGKPLDPPKETK